jgi:hypothetical protein
MDVRRAVRDALVRRVGDPAWWPVADAARFHNRLLDDVGDAGRPDVALLLRLHARDVVTRLPPAALTADAWGRARGALALALANELAADGAVPPADLAWAIDTWALALAVAPLEVIEPATAAPPAAPRGTAGRAAPRSAARHGAAWPRPAHALHRHARPAPVAGASATTTPAPAANAKAHWTQRWNLDAITFGGMFALGILASGFEAWAGLRDRRERAAAERVAAERAAVAPTPAVAPAAALARAEDDSVLLRSGQALTGAIGVITGTHLYLVERASRVTRVVPLATIARAVARGGHVLDLAPLPGTAAPSLLVRGVGGHYAVRSRIVDVGGDAECAASRPLVDPTAVTDEEVVHERGAPTFTMPSRPGVVGTLAPDGIFETAEVTGARGSGAYRWQMQGRFTATGFTAEARATTEVVTKWRSTALCRFVSELTGTRRP